jgi:FAD dependent oxidoreductase
VVLVERAPRLLDAASAINQARIHNGYHYPRSLPTAARSHANYQRFRNDFGDAVVDHHCLYAVSRFDSRVTSAQFERFCGVVGIPLERVENAEPLIDPRAVAALWRADEAVFDVNALRALIEGHVAAAGVDVRLGTPATGLELRNHEAAILVNGEELQAGLVLNCAYGGLERMPGWPESGPPLTYELAEIALVEPPEEMSNVGLTVMDGPFFSCIPAPVSGCHSLTHVRYTPHVACGAAEFPWDAIEHPPPSRFDLMRRAASRFAPWLDDVSHRGSLFATKAVPPERERDDARPIMIRRANAESPVVSVLGGKLDNVYDFLSWLRREIP